MMWKVTPTTGEDKQWKQGHHKREDRMPQKKGELLDKHDFYKDETYPQAAKVYKKSFKGSLCNSFAGEDYQW